MTVERKRKRTDQQRKTVSGKAFGVKSDTKEAKYTRLSRADTRKMELDRKQKENDDAAADGENERARAERENRPKTLSAGKRGDGAFRISFIQMGQGDCTIMSTPEGRVVLIDCGSSNSEADAGDSDDSEDEDEDKYAKRVRGELESDAYLRGTSTIEVVILTHADEDHYNKLERMLPDDYTALTVYHSGEIGHYCNGSQWARTHILHDTLIKKVVLTKDGKNGENSLADKPIDLATPTDRREKLDPTGGLIIVSEPNCVITLLASGVSHPYVQDGDTRLRNRGSVVTLVEVFGKKFLISSDATRATETFLVKNAGRAARLAKVDVVQVGHHGSNTTSSGQPWVDHIMPTEKAIISAARSGRATYHLPSAAVVDRYVQRFNADSRPADSATHQVSAWATTPTGNVLMTYDVDQPVYSTGTTGTEIMQLP